MLSLRIVVVAIAVIIAGAVESNTEVLEATYYGLDEPNESPAAPEIVDVVPSGSQPNTDESEPTNPPDSDVESENRRGGRRPHHHHRGRHHHGRHGSGGADSRRSHHYGMRRGWTGNWTDEQKMNHICSRLQSRDPSASPSQATSGSSSDGRQRNEIHWKLRSLDESTRQNIIDVWNRRKQEMLRCCNENSMDAKMQCASTAKAARYDRVCNGEEPLCHWSAMRSSFRRDATATTATPSSDVESTNSITTRCCALQGTERVTCFTEAKNNYRQRWQERMQHRDNTRGRMGRHHHHHEVV